MAKKSYVNHQDLCSSSLGRYTARFYPHQVGCRRYGLFFRWLIPGSLSGRLSWAKDGAIALAASGFALVSVVRDLGVVPPLVDRALVLNSNWPRHGLSAACATSVRSVASRGRMYPGIGPGFTLRSSPQYAGTLDHRCNSLTELKFSHLDSCPQERVLGVGSTGSTSRNTDRNLTIRLFSSLLLISDRILESSMREIRPPYRCGEL
jgi:hypothetical protein